MQPFNDATKSIEDEDEKISQHDDAAVTAAAKRVLEVETGLEYAPSAWRQLLALLRMIVKQCLRNKGGVGYLVRRRTLNA